MSASAGKVSLGLAAIAIILAGAAIAQSFTLAGVGEKVDTLSGQITGVQGKLADMEGKVTGISGQLSALAAKVAPKTQTFDIVIDHGESWARSPLVEELPAIKDLKIVTWYRWEPSVLVVYKGDKVVLNVTNESGKRVHSLVMVHFGVDTGPLAPKGTKTVEFVADKLGVHVFLCGIPFDPGKTPIDCGPDHEAQMGWLIVLDR